MALFGTPGERIAYSVYPSEAQGAPTLLLLHGFTASAASFDANLAALRRNFNVITVELLGHGQSDAPADPAAYAPGPAVERILGLLDYLGHERVLLCGHSLGGALGLRLALDAPERLSGLVIINSNSAAGTPEWRENARRGMHEMAQRVRNEGVNVMRKTRLYPAHSKRLDSRSRELLVRDFERLTAEGVAGTAEALVVDVNCFERLDSLRVPTLVVLGDRDADFVKNAPGFVNRLPGDYVYTARLDGAGHAANIEQPEAFERALLTFASEIGLIDAPRGRPTKGRNFGTLALTAVGAALVMGGIALLTASFLTGGSSNNGPERAAAAVATPTAKSATTPVITAVAGVRTEGPSPTAPATATAPTTPTPAPPPPTSVPTKPANAAPPPPTATPTETPTPTPTPTATPSPTPTGPYALISGPGSGAPGEILTFFDESRPPEDVQQHVWSAGGAATIVDASNPAAVRIKFPAAGCYTVSLTVSMRGRSSTFTASERVTIGDAICN